MSMKRWLGIFIFVIPLFLTSCDQDQRTPEENAALEKQANEEKEIRAQIKLYIDAINQRDTDKIAEFWIPNAVYKNPITGELVQGREGIKRDFEKILNQLKDAKVEFKIERIRFPVDGKASEEGMSLLKIPGREPISSEYKMSHVKQDGKWLIMHVSQLDFGMLNNEPKK